MEISQLFLLFNSIAMIAWLPLFFLPRHRISLWYFKNRMIPSLLSIIYLGLFIWIMTDSSSPALDFSFEGIKLLFANDKAILLGWVHYLAFDLMTGIYMAEDAGKRKIPHLLLTPCLLFTFMLGPIGWLAYWILRSKYPIKSM